jgi:hypothetical protein
LPSILQVSCANRSFSPLRTTNYLISPRTNAAVHPII